MGFMDEAAGGGGPPLLKFNKEARYAKAASDEAFNDQEFVADVRAARAATSSSGEGASPGEPPWADLSQGRGAAPLLSRQSPTRVSGVKGKFGDEPEDPWTAVIEIPLQARGDGRRVSVLRPIQNVARCRARFSHAGPAGAARDSTPSSASASAASSPSSDQSRSRC